MTEGLLPETIRADIEAGVAAAFAEPDLRSALDRAGDTGVPDDQDDVDLIVMLVPHTHGASWSSRWIWSDTFAPYLHGYIFSAIQAQDIAAGRKPRPLKDYQQEWLTKWEGQSLYQNERDVD